MNKEKGFTLIELLVYMSLFGVLITVLTSILIIASGTQSRQSAEAELSNQNNFVLQTIHRLVADSTTVAVMIRNDIDESGNQDDQDANRTGSVLRIRTIPSNTVAGGGVNDPIFIYLNNGAVMIKKGTAAAAVPLTTNKVTASNLTFTKQTSYPGHDVISVNLTLAHNSPSLSNVSRTILGSVSRVSAATFDDSVYPGANNSFDLGRSTERWRDGYFQGNLYVIGGASAQTLEVNGALKLNTTAAKPSCNSTNRGMFWVTQAAAGTKDDVQVCAKDSANNYGWRTIY